MAVISMSRALARQTPQASPTSHFIHHTRQVCSSALRWLENKRSAGDRSRTRCAMTAAEAVATEEVANERFVKLMRGAQPYFHAHKGSTFVVVISGEVVDSPHLDPILQVVVIPVEYSDFSDRMYLVRRIQWRK